MMATRLIQRQTPITRLANVLLSFSKDVNEVNTYLLCALDDNVTEEELATARAQIYRLTQLADLVQTLAQQRGAQNSPMDTAQVIYDLLNN